MIVDGKGNLFEDRRKNKEDRRTKRTNTTSKVKDERRKEDRRKAPEQVKKHGYTK